MRRTILLRLLALAVLLAACSAAVPSPSPSPSPSPGVPLTTAEMRYALIDRFGPLWYCDPDFYPVPRDDEARQAVERFDEVRAEAAQFATIAARLGVNPAADVTAGQKLALYRAWKQVNAILLEPVDGGRLRFDYLNAPAPGATDGRRTSGTIGADGAITIEQQAAAGEPNCPICLARGTRIATPDGEVAVEDIRVGRLVWSIDAGGRWAVATVVRIGRTPVAASHRVVRLVLGDGRVLRASPGHPLADGRLLAAIRAGEIVDGARVVSATLEAYAGESTFDLLPSGPTGVYRADGVALVSTFFDGGSR
ncbi:MAG TPA: Hint domain-containing protein [Patescibacteria group bacterium]|nr:Hint domain-containing protein [Patescibacteria group bacterium]